MFGDSRYVTSNTVRYYTICRLTQAAAAFPNTRGFKAMKTKLTLRVDAALIGEARVMAADRGISLNAFLCEQLQQIVGTYRSFRNAKRRALARLGAGLDLRWTPPRSRSEVHRRR